jgi:hypothetical protein
MLTPIGAVQPMQSLHAIQMACPVFSVHKLAASLVTTYKTGPPLQFSSSHLAVGEHRLELTLVIPYELDLSLSFELS